MLIKKIIALLLLTGLAFTSFSCEPDYVSNQPQVQPQNPNPQNPNPQPGTTSIVGKWKKKGITDLSEDSIALHDHECTTIFDYIEFFSNGTAKDVSYLEDCVTTEEDSGSYTVSGNTLTIQANDPQGDMISGQLTILELSTTKLKIKLPDLDFVIIYEKY